MKQVKPRSTRRDRQHRRGFTLLEIIVVVTIIAILATLIAPRLLGNIDKAKRARAQSECAQIAQQVSIWLADHGLGSLPDDFRLEELAQGQDRVLNMDDLVDPWGNPYLLFVPGERNRDFDIVSYGADGEPGGDKENADITNGDR